MNICADVRHFCIVRRLKGSKHMSLYSERTTISDIYGNSESYGGKNLTVCGWAKTVRSSKTVSFIDLNDGSCFKSIQIVFESDKLENYKEVAALNSGAAVIVTGTLLLTPSAKQAFELNAQSITIEGVSSPEYPLQPKQHSFEFLRSIAHLRPRANTYNAVFRVRSAAAFAIHKFFNENGFIYVNTPIITASDAEGAGQMFRVTTLDALTPPLTDDGKVDFSMDFFGKATNLTVSGQLEAECFALAYGKVYTFGPTFRAEVSYTQRHAAEFWMIEPEMAFAELSDYMDVAESMTKYVIDYVMKTCPDDMAFFNKFVDKSLLDRLTSLVNADFGRVTYTEAVHLLENSGKKFEYPVYWGCDLQTEHERYLTEEVFKRPVFVTDYPKDIKAFYMRLNDDGKTVAAADMLVPGVGELIGGSQREERLDVLTERMNDLHMDTDDYKWYLDLRRYGGVRHAGFGLGFERLIMYITGMSNIRDVEAFPRTTGSAQY